MAAVIGAATNGYGGKGSRRGRGRGGAIGGTWQPRESKPTKDAEVSEKAASAATSEAAGGQHAEARSSCEPAPEPDASKVCPENAAPNGKHEEKGAIGRARGRGRGKGSYTEPIENTANARSSTDSPSAGDGDFPTLPSGDGLRPATSSEPQSSSHALAQQLKNMEQRVAHRKGAVFQLRGDIRKFQEEAQDATRQEYIFQSDSTSTHAQAKNQEELLLERTAELQLKLEENADLSLKRSDRERQWQEELSSMQYQQDAASERTANIERSAAAWRKAAADSQRRLKTAEAKTKGFEAKREEHRVLKTKLHSQAVELLQAKRDAQTDVQELRKQINLRDYDVGGSVHMWQVGTAVLLVLLLLLLFL